MKKFIWPSLIILLFLFTRLYKITQIPSSVYWDEASIGYNAYAISTDLKDEWGDTLPLHFRAFGEFKLPVYIYSVAALTKLIGLDELAVRLPSVLFSLGSVIWLYLLVKRITKSNIAGILSAFLLTISPWLFIFSRTGYEASAGLFFFLGYIYFLLFNNNWKFNSVLVAFFAILSFYSYNSFRILIPMVFGIYLIKTYLIDRQKLKIKAIKIIALSIFVLSLIPVIRLYRYDAGAIRLSTVGINDPKMFVANYFFHFNYNFLFKDGDVNDRSQVPGWGQEYIIDLPLMVLGLIALIKSKNKYAWLILSFILISPIPASLTRESPHALRSILMAPALSIVSTLGILWVVENKFIKKYKSILLYSIVVVYLLFFGKYYRDFILTYNVKTSSSWQVEYKDIFSAIEESNNTSQIVITDEFAQPYIFALYYLKYSPKEFRDTVRYNLPDKWGFSTVESFGNFQFKKI